MSVRFAALAFLAVFIFMNEGQTHAKVVVLFSIPHAANVRTHTNVGRALTKMGHDAYVCIPQFMVDNDMVNMEGIKVIAYGDYLGNPEELFLGSLAEDFWTNGAGSFQIIRLTAVIQNVVRQILSDQILITKLKEITPDLFVISQAPPFINFVVLPYMLDVPFAYMSPFNDLSTYRVPFSPPATACPMSGFNEKGLSFMERLKNTFCNIMVAVAGRVIADSNLIVEFAPHRPQISLIELAGQAEIYLVESDYILDFAKPQLPNVKLIGSTAPTPGKPLKDPVKAFVEGSKNGVAVVTFGSAIVNLPDGIAKKMASAFQQQDLSVVWRVNYSSPAPQKIMTSLWVPQNDLLAHKNTKLFVSHCGANGQYEALFHGVPILCLPLNGDQHYNAQRSTSKGFGLQGNIFETSDVELAALMREVSSSEFYRSNMGKASTLFKQLFKVPEKEAAFWINHVMEYGGSYMRSAGQDMPLYQYLALDVMMFVAFVITLSMLIIYKLVRCCCHVCCRCCGKQRVNKRNKMD